MKKVFMFVGIFCLLFNSYVFANDDYVKTKFEIIDTVGKQKLYSNKIIIDESNNTINFKFLCKNDIPCGSVVKGNINNFIIFYNNIEVDVKENKNGK